MPSNYLVERNQFTLNKNSSQDGDNQRHGRGGREEEEEDGVKWEEGMLKKMLLESAPKSWEKINRRRGRYEIYTFIKKKNNR